MVDGKNFSLIYNITSAERKGTEVKYIDILEAILENDKSTTAPRGKKNDDKLRLTAMVQLCLFPMILDLNHNNGGVRHWDASQKAVYGLNQKMFEGQFKNRVKLDFFVNTLNFFKFHFKTGKGEGVLNRAYSKLPRDQRPQLWCGKVPIGTQSMQGHWKGAWSECPLFWIGSNER